MAENEEVGGKHLKGKIADVLFTNRSTGERFTVKDCNIVDVSKRKINMNHKYAVSVKSKGIYWVDFNKLSNIRDNG